jgi:hypothetical protein
MNGHMVVCGRVRRVAVAQVGHEQGDGEVPMVDVVMSGGHEDIDERDVLIAVGEVQWDRNS